MSGEGEERSFIATSSSSSSSSCSSSSSSSLIVDRVARAKEEARLEPELVLADELGPPIALMLLEATAGLLTDCAEE